MAADSTDPTGPTGQADPLVRTETTGAETIIQKKEDVTPETLAQAVAPLATAATRYADKFQDIGDQVLQAVRDTEAATARLGAQVVAIEISGSRECIDTTQLMDDLHLGADSQEIATHIDTIGATKGSTIRTTQEQIKTLDTTIVSIEQDLATKKETLTASEAELTRLTQERDGAAIQWENEKGGIKTILNQLGGRGSGEAYRRLETSTELVAAVTDSSSDDKITALINTPNLAATIRNVKHGFGRHNEDLEAIATTIEEIQRRQAAFIEKEEAVKMKEAALATVRSQIGATEDNLSRQRAKRTQAESGIRSDFETYPADVLRIFINDMLERQLDLNASTTGQLLPLDVMPTISAINRALELRLAATPIVQGLMELIRGKEEDTQLTASAPEVIALVTRLGRERGQLGELDMIGEQWDNTVRVLFNLARQLDPEMKVIEAKYQLADDAKLVEATFTPVTTEDTVDLVQAWQAAMADSILGLDKDAKEVSPAVLWDGIVDGLQDGGALMQSLAQLQPFRLLAIPNMGEAMLSTARNMPYDKNHPQAQLQQASIVTVRTLGNSQHTPAVVIVTPETAVSSGGPVNRREQLHIPTARNLDVVIQRINAELETLGTETENDSKRTRLNAAKANAERLVQMLAVSKS